MDTAPLPAPPSAQLLLPAATFAKENLQRRTVVQIA